MPPQKPKNYPTAPEPGVIPLHLVLATVSKVLCSAVFLSNRSLEDALEYSAPQALFVHHLHEVLVDLIDVDVDDEHKTVTVSLTLDEATAGRIVEGYQKEFADFEADWTSELRRLVALGRVERTSGFLGDQGSVIMPRDGRTLGFTPTPVRSALPDPATQDWPAGDRETAGTHGADVRRLVGEAIDEAFDPSAATAGVVVLHDGEIVGERYREGISRDTQLESWSMGKSLTATLVGVLVQEGHLRLDEPAPIPEWRQPGDPRGSIRVRDLLQMSSGLLFSGQDDVRSDWRLGVPDHLYIYSEAVDAFDWARDRPAEFPPGTVGRYRNCDPLSLGYIIKRIVTERLQRDYLQWPQEALFDRVGIRRQVMETDWFGNFLLTGFDYGTARNWARLGLLYLRDGMWGGERVLPEGWSTFVSSPAPGWDEPCYGGQFWLNGLEEFDLPKEAYFMAGFGEQRVFVVPSAGLVIVRLGHRSDTDHPRAATNRMLRKLMAVFSPAT